jgi:predicted nucleic acid-binding protein
VEALSPGSNFWTFFRQIIMDSQVAVPLMSDAKLAALALERGATVCTHDLDFSRFKMIQVEFPLRS